MKKNIVLFPVLTTISCLLLLQYYYHTSDINIQISNDNGQVKNILYYTKMFGSADFYLGLGSKIFEGCEVSNCYATSNKSYLPLEEFDALLFHGNEHLSDEMMKPENRSQHQYYIYSNQESPTYASEWSESDNFFNWTMTYRADSDILRPYGYYKKIITNYTMPTVKEVRQKPLKVAWMVSHCDTQSERYLLYKKLSRYIPIDVYGSCGNKSCPKENFDGCYDLLAKNYKFYLSFENSICSEYATEKLYAASMRDFVPIVYGGADYTKIAPSNSVIDVTKFSTVKELADYIKTLHENPEKYLSYFKWKKEYVVSRDGNLTLCTLCKKLHEPIVHKSYNNINTWWQSGMCRAGNKLPKILFT